MSINNLKAAGVDLFCVRVDLNIHDLIKRLERARPEIMSIKITLHSKCFHVLI